MEIIEAMEKDVPDIVDLWIGMMDYHKDLNPYHTLREGAEKNWETFLRNRMASETSRVLIAIDEGKPIAYLISSIKEYPPLFRLDNYGFISDMFVEAGYRHKGIGEALVKEVFKWLDGHDIRRIELRVEPANDIGYDFWRKLGFKDFVHVLALDR